MAAGTECDKFDHLLQKDKPSTSRDMDSICHQQIIAQSAIDPPISRYAESAIQHISSNKESSLSLIKSNACHEKITPPSKGHRSSVRPFFCCGSELSLVSLVESIELKESNKDHDENFQNAQSSIFDGDNLLVETKPAAIGGISDASHLTYTSTRRKKKDKQIKKKKKFWSLQSKSHPGPRHSPKSKRSSCVRENSHPNSSLGNSAALSTMPGLSRINPSVHCRSVTAASPLLDLLNLVPLESNSEDLIRRRADDVSIGLEIEIHAQVSRAFRSNVEMTGSMMDILRFRSRLSSTNSDTLYSSDSPIEDLLVNNLLSQVQNPNGSLDSRQPVHTQIDYVHHLVPDLTKITSSSFYWGVMDRYEAEKLLENKPPGTFLLRDSAQEDFLFSVSFRRYNRSLHARIEQWNHRFSFDAHDPNVFSAQTICELVEHYKDPSLCMFFEPMLIRPLHRTFPFSLQHMSRTVICDRIVYDDIHTLPIPNSFKKLLQTYHYKQKIRMRRFDQPEMASAESRVIL